LLISGFAKGVNETTFQTRTGGPYVSALNQINGGTQSGEHDAEPILFTTFPDDGDGNSLLVPLSTSLINDGGTFKTMLKYLYDNGGTLYNQINNLSNIDLNTLTGEETFPLSQTSTSDAYQISLLQLKNILIDNPYSNGIIFCTQSRDFNSNDEGKLIAELFFFFFFHFLLKNLPIYL